MLYVKEIVSSINGEANPFTQGSPAIFVRFAGCNFYDHPCAWCDTTHALGKSGSTSYTNYEDILSYIQELARCFGYNPVVVLTGGEPLFQEHDDLLALTNELHKQFCIVLETNGSYHVLHKLSTQTFRIVMDFKLSSSGNLHKMDFRHFLNLTERDMIKFPIETEQDILEAKYLTQKYFTYDFAPKKVLSPINPVRIDKKLNNQIVNLALQENMLVSVQIHKVLGIY